MQAKIQQASAEKRNAFDDAWKDILKPPDKLLSLIIPIDSVQLAKSAKLVELYVEIGVYEYADMLIDAYRRLGEMLGEYYPYMKQAYFSHWGAAGEEITNRITDAAVLKNFDLDALLSKIQTSNNETEGTNGSESTGAGGNGALEGTLLSDVQGAEGEGTAGAQSNEGGGADTGGNAAAEGRGDVRRNGIGTGGAESYSAARRESRRLGVRGGRVT